MKVVYKYPLANARSSVVPIPATAQLLKVAMQGKVLCIWVLLDPNDVIRKGRIFHTYATGTPLDTNKKLVYVDTFFTENRDYVWHVFEEVQ